MSRLRISRMLPHYRRLMRDGTPGRAVVVKSEMTKLTTSAARYAYRLTLEVHYDDGTTAEVVRTVTPLEVGIQHSVGDVLPVRYDRADHTDVDIDVAAVRAAQQAERDRIDERRVASARAALDEPPPAPAPPPSAASDAEAERLTSEWLERLVRLKLGHAAGAVSDGEYAARLTTARAGLHDSTQVPVTGEDRAFVAALAAAVIGDPIPGDAEDVTNAVRAAGLLETVVGLKLRRESGELDEAGLHAAMAEAGRAVQEEAERLDGR